MPPVGPSIQTQVLTLDSGSPIFSSLIHCSISDHRRLLRRIPVSFVASAVSLLVGDHQTTDDRQEESVSACIITILLSTTNAHASLARRL